MRAVLEDWRLVVHAGRESVIVTQQGLRHRLLASHQLEFHASVLHEGDDSEGDETGLHVLGQRNHRQLAVIARLAHRQVEVWKVKHVVLVLRLFVEEPDLGRSADDVVGDDALNEDRFDAVHATEVDAHVSEGFLLAAPTGHRVQTDVPRLVIRPLRGGVYRRVRDSSGSEAEWSHDLALGLANADDRSRVDENVARSRAAESDLRALLVASRLLIAVARSSGILANRTLASQVAKVPHTVPLASHDVVVVIGLTGQLESVLAAKVEGRLVFGVWILAVLGARRRQRLPAVDSRASGLQAGQPVIGIAGFRIVHALSESGGCAAAQVAAVAVALESDVLLERHQHPALVDPVHGETLVLVVRQRDALRV